MAMAVVSFALAVAYLVYGRRYPVLPNGQPGAGLYPLVIGVFWTVVSAASLVEAWLARSDGSAPVVEWPDRAGWIRIGVVLISAVAYVLLVGTVGELAMGFLVVAAIMRAMGLAHPAGLIAASAVLALASHVVFVTVLNVPLPRGVLGIG